jgi:hypothetical protein
MREDDGAGWTAIADHFGITQEGARSKYRLERSLFVNPVFESPYPSFDNPLVMEGDAIVFPDTEFPYHNAEFINNCLDLADAWKIDKAILAGDALHFNSISKWEASWKADGNAGISEKAEKDLLDLDLSSSARQKIIAIIQKYDTPSENDAGSEIATSRDCLTRLGQQFEKVDYVIGNHDGRFLAALNSPIFARQLLQFIGVDNPKFRIAPYYFSWLDTERGRFRIVHPKGAAASTAYNLASKFQCHILMAHSHRWSVLKDRSGSFYAIQMGCCVDETKLAYAAQRDVAGDAHALGAVIVRGGYPFLLGVDTPWSVMKRL